MGNEILKKGTISIIKRVIISTGVRLAEWFNTRLEDTRTGSRTPRASPSSSGGCKEVGGGFESRSAQKSFEDFS